MQIIVNDYVLQRLQQLPLSSTRLARSTLRILVLKMLRLAPAKRCDCYRQSWAILTRPIFTPPRVGVLPYKKDGVLDGNFEKNHIKLLWFTSSCFVDVTWRDTILKQHITACYIIFNPISKRYCKISRCLSFEAQHPKRYHNHFFNPWKVRRARRTVWRAGFGRILVSVRRKEPGNP